MLNEHMAMWVALRVIESLGIGQGLLGLGLLALELGIGLANSRPSKESPQNEKGYMRRIQVRSVNKFTFIFPRFNLVQIGCSQFKSVYCNIFLFHVISKIQYRLYVLKCFVCSDELRNFKKLSLYLVNEKCYNRLLQKCYSTS